MIKSGILILILSLFSLPLFAGQSMTAIPGKIAAPDFELIDTDGNTHRLSDYRGKTVVINFWATWCPPCREEIPSMNRAYEVLADENVEILAINMGEDEDTIFIL
jgi:thiol-disulfide isomerase/thioredoxin